MKNVNLFLLLSVIFSFDLTAQTVFVQLSGGSSLSAGLIHPTANGQDFTIKDALSSTAPGVFADGELQLLFKKFGVGAMYSLNSMRLNGKDFKENRGATSTNLEQIEFQSFMLQILLRQRISEKMGMQFSLSGGRTFLNESTHQIDFPTNPDPNVYFVKYLNIQPTLGWSVNLAAQLNRSVHNRADLFLKFAMQVTWMSPEINFTNKSYPISTTTLDFLSFVNNIGLGARFRI